MGVPGLVFLEELGKSTVAGWRRPSYDNPMKLLEDDSAVMTKARDLCETITADAEYQDLLAKVETFLGDDEARSSYQAVHQQGQELNQKQQAGLQLAESEIAEFESARSRLLENSVASDFLKAQQSLETLQSSVSRLVGMTLELGRVPTAEDIAQASGGGCCGGSGGGGCGC